nr:hypothetical protein Q903MT_gene747 [Picea sitchensis]
MHTVMFSRLIGRFDTSVVKGMLLAMLGTMR